jgi:uncharacterized protein (TIGR02996 family)
MTRWLLAGERELLAAVVADLADDAPKLVYADWLEERGDDRSEFLRAYVKAARSMSPSDFPRAKKGLPEEWLELIGYRLLELVAEQGFPELKGPALRLARPALRMKKGAAGRKAPVGASKVGGLPDLPPGFRWPPGGDCHATYNDDTGGTDRLAGFLAQINFAEVAHTEAARRDLPEEGLLSFFCFQDIENDNPDAIGAKAVFFPSPAGLVRTRPPQKLTEGNGVIPAQRLTFEETLDLPEPYEGPWSKELVPRPGADYSAVFDRVRERNFYNVLGYARATSGADPTPSKQSRHLVVLENAAGCQLHIQLSQKNLAARKFEAITLNWVEFD